MSKVKELFTKAIKAMNKLLADNKEQKIKVGGVKQAVIAKSLEAKIDEYLEAGRDSELPDAVVKYHDEVIMKDDDEEVEEKKPAKKVGKKEKATKKTGKKEKAPKKEKAAKKEKAPKKEKKAAKGLSREASVSTILKGRKQITIEDLAVKSDDLYVKKGGTSNQDQATRAIKRMIKFLTPLEIVDVDDKGKIIVNM